MRCRSYLSQKNSKFACGDEVLARWKDCRRYPAKFVKYCSNRNVTVKFDGVVIHNCKSEHVELNLKYKDLNCSRSNTLPVIKNFRNNRRDSVDNMPIQSLSLHLTTNLATSPGRDGSVDISAIQKSLYSPHSSDCYINQNELNSVSNVSLQSSSVHHTGLICHSQKYLLQKSLECIRCLNLHLT
jgi:hypothetical protein